MSNGAVGCLVAGWQSGLGRYLMDATYLMDVRAVGLGDGGLSRDCATTAKGIVITARCPARSWRQSGRLVAGWQSGPRGGRAVGVLVEGMDGVGHEQRGSRVSRDSVGSGRSERGQTQGLLLRSYYLVHGVHKQDSRGDGGRIGITGN